MRAVSRWLALLVIVGVVAVPVVLASTARDSAPRAGEAFSDAEQTARRTAATMSSKQLLGQRVVSGYVGTTPPKSVLSAAREGRIGGVILFANNMPTAAVARRAIAKLQRAARLGKMPPLLVMIDQEGGIVQRLTELPPTRSPASIGRSSDPARTARAQGRATGKALKRYGFNVNLAPVVDVVKVKNSFLGNRAYSRKASVVGAAGCAFAAGNQQYGVAASFKHFPGLGRAGADTDFNDVTIRENAAQLREDIKPYRRCPSTPKMVMISSARYPAQGINRPASLVRKTYKLLADTGFDGVTITDALETPQFDARSDNALSALRAGADILLWSQAWRTAMRARGRLVDALSERRLTRAELLGGTERILKLKAEVAN